MDYKVAHIYFLNTLSDPAPVYVGSTTQRLQARKENHCSDMRGFAPIKVWIKKLKADGKLKELCINLIETVSLTDRFDREEYWTRVLKTTLNLRIGVKHNEDHKQMMAKKLRGRKMTECQIKKMILAQALKAKKVVIDGVVYDSIQKAGKESGLSPGFICSVAKGNKKSNSHSIRYFK